MANPSKNKGTRQTKRCERCGATFKRPHIADAQWAARRYCSHACAQAARIEPLDVRLWRRVQVMPNGCWEWQGFRQSYGYGEMGRGPRGAGLINTHRAAWVVTHGEIPDDLHVLHHCDNPPCCNPDHLFLGTNADNSADKVAKGRQAKGPRLPQTKLTDEQVREIRARYVREFSRYRYGWRSNARELAAEFDISEMYIFQLIAGKYRAGVA